MEKRNFEDNYKIMKALSDINRMSIIYSLTNGEMCACKILENLNITQPTLSHHMKILSECGLVSSRKKGKWMHYSLNSEKISKFKNFILNLTTLKEDSDEIEK